MLRTNRKKRPNLRHPQLPLRSPQLVPQRAKTSVRAKPIRRGAPRGGETD